MRMKKMGKFLKESDAKSMKFVFFSYCLGGKVILYHDKMHENKNDQLNHIKDIITNHLYNRPRPYKMPSHLANPITHQVRPNYSTILSNPEEQNPLFSIRKSIPKNTEVIKERSQMILHPSYSLDYARKVSKDVPSWIKGQTYKYYNRNEFNQLNQRSISNTIDNSRNIIGTIDHNYNRSDMSTPRSRRSSDADIFYIGGGQRQPYMRRSSLRRESKEISGKIGSTETRNFQLPKILLKIGKEEYINTHRPI